MSFVGTRPEATKYVEKYSNEMLATLLLISDLVSILCGRGCTPVHSMAVGRSENTCS